MRSRKKRGPQHVRFGQDERAAGGAGRMPVQRVSGTYPQPRAGAGGFVLDVHRAWDLVHDFTQDRVAGALGEWCAL